MADPVEKNIQIKDVSGNLLFPKTKAAVVYNNSNEALGTVEAGAQVNVLEGVQLNGTDLTITDKKVNVVIPAAAEYTITKQATAEEGYSATYQLFKDSTAVGDKINIPKDMVVEEGSLKYCEEKDKPVAGLEVGDPYIDLKLANTDDKHIYIPVKGLVDIYTVGDTDSVDMTMTDNNITADVRISAKTGNALSIQSGEGEKGLYVAEDFVQSVEDTACVDLTVDSHKLTADVKLSANANNAITKETDGLHVNISGKVDKNADITAATKCKITYDAKGLVTAGADLAASDIPSLELTKISDVTATAAEVNVLDGIEASTAELNYVKGVTSAIQTQIDGKVAKNADIIGATKCKITYDAKGLVTAGADLTADDIPSLALAKISDVTATAAEVNALHEAGATKDDFTKLHAVTATAAELNVLDGIEASTTELNYVKGVTSAIQTQLDSKLTYVELA